jgi:hypothetical protein
VLLGEEGKTLMGEDQVHFMNAIDSLNNALYQADNSDLAAVQIGSEPLQA